MSKILESTLTCPTSVLAAQMRKVVPSSKILNSRSSVSVVDNLLDKKERPARRRTFASVRNVNVTSEVGI